MTRARDLANIADGTFTATDLNLSGTLDVSGDATFDTNTLFVDVSANEVGIGTTSPAGLLHLNKSNSGSDVELRIQNSAVSSGDTATLRFSVTSNSAFDSAFVGSDRNNALILGANDAERARIDSSGNVGIGTTSPSAKFVVTDNSTKNVEIGWDSSSSAMRILSFDRTSVLNVPLELRAQDIRFETNTGGTGTERMRIDSSGNLLVGTTSTPLSMISQSTGNGIGAEGSNGYFVAKRSSNSAAIYVNKTGGNSGTYIQFRDDGTLRGQIFSYVGTRIGIGSSGASGVIFGASAVVPATFGQTPVDATYDLGSSSYRYKDLYRSGSTFSTSDRNAKQDERPLTEAEANVAQACKGLLKAFRFIDAVETDGDGARIHFGIIAQDLQAAFEAEGLDANRYQMFRSSTFTNDEGNEETRLGVCYENLLAFIIAAL